MSRMPMVRRGLLPSAVVLAFVSIAACAGGDSVSPEPLDGTTWEMTAVRAGESLEAANPTSIVTVEFADDVAFGFDGCNRFQAAFSTDGQSIAFGEPSRTGHACEAHDFEPQGDIFIAAVEAAQRYAVSDQGLQLTAASGEILVRFRPASDLPLVGVSWWLDGYAGAEDGMVSPVARISLTFVGTGTLSGIGGCNEYSADYRTDGSGLIIALVVRTESVCSDPHGVMTQESDYVKALEQVESYTTTLTDLELRDSEGIVVLQYRFGGRTR